MGGLLHSPQLHIAAAGAAGGGGEKFAAFAQRDAALPLLDGGAIPFRDGCGAFFDHFPILLGLYADETLLADDHLLSLTITTEAAGTVNFSPSVCRGRSATTSGSSKVLWAWISPETTVASTTL